MTITNSFPITQKPVDLQKKENSLPMKIKHLDSENADKQKITTVQFTFYVELFQNIAF